MPYWQRLGEFVYNKGVRRRNPSVLLKKNPLSAFFGVFFGMTDVDVVMSSAVMI